MSWVKDSLRDHKKLWVFFLIVFFALVAGSIFYKSASKPVPNVQTAPQAQSENAQVRDYERLCMQQMVKYARDNNAEPAKYISNNQAYLKKCVEYKISNPAGTIAP